MFNRRCFPFFKMRLRPSTRSSDEDGAAGTPRDQLSQHQEGRGMGITNKMRAYALQDEGADTIEANLRLGFEADHRRYDQCAEVIKLLGVGRVRLMSNNPDKLRALCEAGIEVVERVPLEIKPKAPAFKYLVVKKEKMGHLLQLNGIF